MDVERVLDNLGIDYYRTGDRLMTCCVFHNDTHPSCGLWIDSGYFKCFACGEEGSLVEFVVEVAGVSKYEAIRIVRNQDSISDMEDSLCESLDRREAVFQYFNRSSFCATYPKVLPETAAWDYLTNRGINRQSIERFHARWGGDVGKYHHRVIFPIMTVDGKLLSYVGRAIKKGMMPKTRKARSPHRTLFGLYELLRKVGEVPLLIIVEGEFDAIYLQQFGVPAVANMGTSSLGAEKLRLLTHHTKKVVLSYDMDEAGWRAMHGDDKRCGELKMLQEHFGTAFVHLPDGLDPNGLSAEQVEEFYGEWRMPCLIS